MYKQELNKAFSSLHASDDLVKEVLTMERKNSLFTWKNIRRVAVCAMAVAAIVLTVLLWPDRTEPGVQIGAPTTQLPTEPEQKEIVATAGVLKLYACEASNVPVLQLPEYELTESISTKLVPWSPLYSACGEGIPFTFTMEENYFGSGEVTFEISADFGEFGIYATDGLTFDDSVTIGNDGTIYWRTSTFSDIRETVGDGGIFYADVLILVDGEVAGYGVISFRFSGSFVCAERFMTVCFPPVDGQLQDISEDYIWGRIAEYKGGAHM